MHAGYPIFAGVSFGSCVLTRLIPTTATVTVPPADIIPPFLPSILVKTDK